MDYGLDEEIVAIESIYDTGLLDRQGDDIVLNVPNTDGVQLRIHFAPDYPEQCPDVVAVVSSGSSTVHGYGSHVSDMVTALLRSLWTPGTPVLHPLMEELQSTTFEDGHTTTTPADVDQGYQSADNPDDDNDAPAENWPSQGPSGKSPQVKDEAGPTWFASALVTEKKSSFVAHACRVADPDQARTFVESLIRSNRSFAKATHNMSAYRGIFRSAAPSDEAGEGREIVFHDCDDDGEDAAGGRLLHLLELTGANNVLVVVSRWYGGIKLGPDRFRIINQVAREALLAGGFVNEGSKPGEGKKGGRKGK